jgi:hypothetical protein
VLDTESTATSTRNNTGCCGNMNRNMCSCVSQTGFKIGRIVSCPVQTAALARIRFEAHLPSHVHVRLQH